jgi:hypothetical protein
MENPAPRTIGRSIREQVEWLVVGHDGFRPIQLGMFALVSLASHGVSAAYLCIPDDSVGFVYDKQTHRWTPDNFSVEGKRYVLSEKDGH